MSFYDLLKAPLPSKYRQIQESEDSTTYDNMDYETNQNTENDKTKTVVEGDDMESEPDTILSRDHTLSQSLSGSNSYSDTTLTPDESQHVDDVMNTVATPILLADELKDDSIKEFVESIDSDIAISEGFLTEKTIVKFDKNAKRSQLYEIAVSAVAREKNDPLYRKLETVYKMERILKAKLRKKYHSQANIKVKEYLARAKKSKSGILSKIAKKIIGDK